MNKDSDEILIFTLVDVDSVCTYSLTKIGGYTCAPPIFVILYDSKKKKKKNVRLYAYLTK